MKVSVIIPCYDVDKYIANCLNSVLNHTYANLEIICIDDGSTDDTLKILNEFRKKYLEKIIVIEQENKGASSARNRGIEIAKGEWIQFLDADDILLPGKISWQMELIRNAANKTDIVIGNYSRINLKNEKKNYASETGDIWFGLLKTKLGITSSNLWNKKKLIECGKWNTSYSSSQEYELLFRLLNMDAKIIFDSKFNTLVRDREKSISYANRKRNWITYCMLRNEIINYIIVKKINPEHYPLYYQALFDSIRTLYQFDKTTALKFYKEFIPKNFKPQVSASTTKAYINAFTLIGFKATEEMKSLLKSG